MRIETQLVSFLSFFIFGFALSFINFTFLQKKRMLVYPLFAILTLIFMFALYHINGGRIHPYFIAMFLFGILVSKVTVKYLKKRLNLLKAKYKK